MMHSHIKRARRRGSREMLGHTCSTPATPPAGSNRTDNSIPPPPPAGQAKTLLTGATAAQKEGRAELALPYREHSPAFAGQYVSLPPTWTPFHNQPVLVTSVTVNVNVVPLAGFFTSSDVKVTWPLASVTPTSVSDVASLQEP